MIPAFGLGNSAATIIVGSSPSETSLEQQINEHLSSWPFQESQ